MANRIYIPVINPLLFVDKDKVNDDRYYTKYMDEYLFSMRQIPGLQEVSFRQPFSPDDIITLYVETNYTPVQADVLNEYGNSVGSFNFNVLRQNMDNPGFYISKVEIALSTLPGAGCYQVQITAGDPVQKTFLSEIFKVGASIDKTILLEYRNTSFYGDVIFEADIDFAIRIPGLVIYSQPGGKSQVYEDQVMNSITLSARPFDVFKLFVGNATGVPDWFIKKLNRIMGCDHVKIDGKYFTPPEGAKWEAKEEQEYQMKGWSIDLREGLARDSFIFDSEGSTNEEFGVVFGIEGRTFGDLDENGSSNVINITSFQ